MNEETNGSSIADIDVNFPMRIGAWRRYAAALGESSNMANEKQWPRARVITLNCAFKHCFDPVTREPYKSCLQCDVYPFAVQEQKEERELNNLLYELADIVE